MIPNCLKNIEYKPIENRFYYVTPELAKELFNLNIPNNRKLVSYVSIMASIKNDQWVETGEPIKFNIEGQLIDGQNRLKAIIMTGKSQWLEFRFDLPLNTMDYLDSGRARTLADRMKIHGIPYYMRASSITSVIYQLYETKLKMVSSPKRQGGITSSQIQIKGNSSYVTHATLLEYYDKRSIHIQQLITTYTKGYKIYTPNTIAVIAYILDYMGIDNRAEFINYLITGVNLQADNPILFLRAFIEDNHGRKTNAGTPYLNPTDILNRTLLCYDLWRSGVKMTKTPSNTKGLTTQEIISMLYKKYIGKMEKVA